jgi:hypothetical protein
MKRRLTLSVFALLFVAVPLFAKHRGVRPGDAGHCVTGVIATQVSGTRMAADEHHVYGFGLSSLHRVPKNGGTVQQLAVLPPGGVVLSMTVGDTHVYLGVQRFDPATGADLPGEILAIPKSGGVMSTLISGIQMPFDVETDATHVYWADGGMLNPTGPSWSPAPARSGVR